MDAKIRHNKNNGGDDMTELKIKLNSSELRCLRESANKALREPDAQARFILRRALGLERDEVGKLISPNENGDAPAYQVERVAITA